MPRSVTRACFLLAALTSLVLTSSGCATSEPRDGRSALGGGASFPDIGYASWRDNEPAYRLYPGDVVDVTALSAVELNRTVTVQPDGRISLPLIAPVMAADRSVTQLEAALSQAYASQLVRPDIEVEVKSATPLRVFVGGEVGKPGVYDMAGDIDALQAVIMAGGFAPTAGSGKVVIIRRGAGGRAMMRTVNLHRAIFEASAADAVPLRRFDIIYVPRSGVANAGLFVQQYIRNVVPMEFSYAISPNVYATIP